MLVAGAALLATAAGEPVAAEGLSPWGGFESAPYRSRSNSYRAPKQQQNSNPGGFWFGGGDDFWADEPPRRRAVTNERSGGGRPQIVPKAPPLVAFASAFTPGSIVIDQSSRQLYYVVSGKQAYRYNISVGREGFGWEGVEKVSRVAEWPDWYPPAEMRARDRRLPKKMTGGVKNPLGATAIYLGNTLYRIHGTNDPKSIGHASSSGCFRMLNENVRHLASLVQIGAEVHVLKQLPVSVATVGSTG